MKRLFKGGTVVSGRGTKRADVLVEGEKIIAVARCINDADAQVIDVSGMLLMPGFIDAHTHFDLDVAGTTTADDFASGSMAALRGGTTTVIDFACPNKGETLQQGLALWRQKAEGKCCCDYGFHMTIDDWNDTIEQQIDPSKIPEKILEKLKGVGMQDMDPLNLFRITWKNEQKDFGGLFHGPNYIVLPPELTARAIVNAAVGHLERAVRRGHDAHPSRHNRTQRARGLGRELLDLVNRELGREPQRASAQAFEEAQRTLVVDGNARPGFKRCRALLREGDLADVAHGHASPAFHIRVEPLVVCLVRELVEHGHHAFGPRALHE